MSIRLLRLVIHMKYRMHSAGSFDLLIKVNVTFRNADQMCMCFVSLIYMCIVCVCVCGVAGIRSYPSNVLKRLRRKYHISVLCHASHSRSTQYPNFINLMESMVNVPPHLIQYSNTNPISLPIFHSPCSPLHICHTCTWRCTCTQCVVCTNIDTCTQLMVKTSITSR